MATSSIHHRDHVPPEGHRFVHGDKNHPTVVMHTASALVRHALFVVHDDEVAMVVVKMDGQVERGGPGQTHVGGPGAPDGDESAREVVVAAVGLAVDHDREHLGVDMSCTGMLLYIYGILHAHVVFIDKLK